MRRGEAERLKSLDPAAYAEYRRRRNASTRKCAASRKARGLPGYGNSVDQRKWHLQKTYGLSLELFQQMFENQEGLCGVCGCLMNNAKLVSNSKCCVDHCHNTGVVRGLVCHACNKGMGALKDDPWILQGAVNFLQTPMPSYSEN
jgi:hypothetical protein